MEEKLKDWSLSYHETSDYQRTFYLMDKTMKYIHENNYQIASFNPDNIVLGLKEDTRETTYVLYKNIVPFSGDVVKEMHNNMYNLAFLQVGLYTSTLPYLKPEFIKENFNQLKFFLPEEDVSYFQRNLVSRNYFYYSDYKENKNKQEIEKINKSLEEDASGGKGRKKSKTNPYSALYAEEMNEETKMAAFVTNFALPFIIISISLLIPLLSFFFALTNS